MIYIVEDQFKRHYFDLKSEAKTFYNMLLRDGEIAEWIGGVKASEAIAAAVAAEREACEVAIKEIKRTLAGGRTVGANQDQAYRDAEEIADAAIGAAAIRARGEGGSHA